MTLSETMETTIILLLAEELPEEVGHRADKDHLVGVAPLVVIRACHLSRPGFLTPVGLLRPFLGATLPAVAGLQAVAADLEGAMGLHLLRVIITGSTVLTVLPRSSLE